MDLVFPGLASSISPRIATIAPTPVPAYPTRQRIPGVDEAKTRGIYHGPSTCTASHTYVRTMLGGLMLLAVIALVVLVSVSRRASVRSSAAAAATGSKRTYRPRETFDSVGFASVVERIPRWAADTSLEEMSQLWQACRLSQHREDRSQSGRHPVTRSREGRLAHVEGHFFNFEGEPNRAYEVLEAGTVARSKE